MHRLDADAAPDHKEAWSFGPEHLAGTGPMQAENQWPDLHGVREPIERYHRAAMEVCELLLDAMALALGLDICRALHLAHSRGLVHTELTPSKIMFGEEGRARLVDLGLADLLGRSAWREPSSLDNHVVRYSAPEQALGRVPAPGIDIYALGLVLVEAVT